MTTPVTPNHPRPDARKLLQAPRRVEFAAQPKPALPVYPPMKPAASASSSPAPSAIPMPKPTFVDAPAECSRGVKRTASLSELRASDREKLNALLKSQEAETPTTSTNPTPASSPIAKETSLSDKVFILDMNLESTQLSVLAMEKEVKVLEGTVDELDRRTIEDHNYLTRVDEDLEQYKGETVIRLKGLDDELAKIKEGYGTAIGQAVGALATRLNATDAELAKVKAAEGVDVLRLANCMDTVDNNMAARDRRIGNVEADLARFVDRSNAAALTQIEDRKKMMSQIEEFGKKIVDITRTEEAANNLSLASLRSKMEILERNNNLLAARVANMESQLNFEQIQRQSVMMHAILRPPQQAPAFFAPPNGYVLTATENPLVMPKQN